MPKHQRTSMSVPPLTGANPQGQHHLLHHHKLHPHNGGARAIGSTPRDTSRKCNGGSGSDSAPTQTSFNTRHPQPPLEGCPNVPRAVGSSPPDIVWSEWILPPLSLRPCAAEETRPIEKWCGDTEAWTRELEGAAAQVRIPPHPESR
ncbi:uncharacterized protein K444DRAFT_276490 [Hyaloscypha bicolor E]|uniref:Uncharacterized protein n=1 Tax=Hyaloscypha bicolor E TaxID=1095630 RepID=A0A2J6SJ31_9HELO|nr:uncharacterized protein K444DRAFT_276490 [Hyaloscypha bicolor E]PMD50767.1 hypothetical protein K444DRAFT_276490 [Hyaloscypha bicolor E]